MGRWRKQFNLDGWLWKLSKKRRVAASKRCEGICYPKAREIEIKSTLNPKKELAATIHELLHARAPFLSNKYFVGKADKDFARALWKLGYRRTSKSDRRTLGID